MLVLQQTVIPGRVFSRAACPAPVRSIIKQYVLPLGLEVSVHSFAVPEGVWSIELVPHLLHAYAYKSLFCTYTSMYTRVLRCTWKCLSTRASASVPVLLCCSWTCLCTKCVVLLLDVSVYKSFCAASVRDCLQKFLCCFWTCLSTKAFVLLLDVSVYKSFCAAPGRVCL
jgi:hypothetical protein